MSLSGGVADPISSRIFTRGLSKLRSYSLGARLASNVPAWLVTMEDVSVEMVDEVREVASGSGRGVTTKDAGPEGVSGFGL